MTTIRRIYAYLMAFAGLAMVALAAANLLQLLVDLGLQAPLVSTDGYVRNTVSLYAAAALVGLPVWLVHWLWIGRLVRSGPQERASTLRRLYVYAVLVGATLEIIGSARDALFSAFTAVVGPASQSPGAFARPLPFALIALGVWFAHWRIAANDRTLVGETGGSATLRRWYVYGAAFVGLVLLLTGTQGVVETLWRIVAQAGGPVGTSLAQPAADALVGLGLWLVHWMVLPKPDDDRTSVLRSVYLFLALAVGVVGSLSGLSQLLFYAVGRLLGVDHPGGVGGDLLQAAAGPVSITLVYGAAWAYQRQALRRQEPPLPLGEGGGEGAVSPRPHAGVRRLYTYLVALVALGVLTSGVAGLLWTLGDLFLPASAAISGDGWREQVALFATLAIVGLPAWLLHWRRRSTAGEGSRSLARRLYLYLSLIVAMLALVSSAAAGLYKLLGLALGSGFSVSVAADLAHALAVATVATVVTAYHWRVIRGDAHAAQPEVTAEPAEPASAVVEIRAADAASLNRAMSALRSTGAEVIVLPAVTSEDGADVGAVRQPRHSVRNGNHSTPPGH